MFGGMNFFPDVPRPFNTQVKHEFFQIKVEPFS